MRVLRAALCLLALLVLLSLLPGPVRAEDGTVHVVQPGETLRSIAEQYGVTTVDLVRANDLANPDLLSLGQELTIPGPGSITVITPTRTPTPSPTMTSRPEANGAATSARPAVVSVPTRRPAIASITRQPTATPVRTAIPVRKEQRHVVQFGETLRGIAERYDVPIGAIAQASGLASADFINAGMELVIPGNEPPEYTGSGSESPTRFMASISQQHCWLWENDLLIASWDCSTGRASAPTVAGSYQVQSKIENAYGSAWDFWMPYWLGIYYSGSTENGIHGLPYDKNTGARTWEGMVGIPITFGCIMLDDVHAKMLFDIAYIGMPVIILR